MTDQPTLPPKAYRNKTFLNSQDARPLRILSEYLEPKERFEHYDISDTIVFYGSARIPSRETAEAELAQAMRDSDNVERAERRVELSVYYEATRELARRLTEWSKSLGEPGRRMVICSGGGPGIMEAANRGASEAKGVNVGLGISLPFEEGPNAYSTRELAFMFHYFFMRKFWFTYLAKAFVVMPGGFGTLDELFELLTLVQTKKIKKKVPVVLFGEHYWSEVINFDVLEDYGTISPGDRDLCFHTDSVDDAFDYLVETLKTTALEPGEPSL